MIAKACEFCISEVGKFAHITHIPHLALVFTDNCGPTHFCRQFTGNHGPTKDFSTIYTWTFLTVNCLIVDQVLYLQSVTLPHNYAKAGAKDIEKGFLPPSSNHGRPHKFVGSKTNAHISFMFKLIHLEVIL